MTSERLTETVVEPAAERARDTGGHRRIWIAGILIIVGVLVLAITYLLDRTTLQGQLSDLNRHATTLHEQIDRTDAAARALADQIRKLGQQPVVNPADLPKPEPVRGIAGTTITADGRLLVAYTDGRTEDKGRVVGREGPPGQSPPSIVSTDLADGVLVLRFSDGRSEVVGRVVGRDGAPGRGVASVAITSGRLVVAYTDGTTQDAGPLPAGPQGPAGRGIAHAEVRSCRWYVTYTDGVTEDAGNACVAGTSTLAPTPTTGRAPRPSLPLPTSR